MRVKIIKASIKSYWYADKIGQEFEVEPYNSGYKTIFPIFSGLKGAIDYCDCEIVNEPTPTFIRRFPTGAIRSDNRGRERFDFISPLALKELAQFLATTENSFAQTNYFLGIPEEACLESLLRHINDFRINGKKEEAVALLFNAVALVHTIALRERGEYIERYDKTEYITKEQYNHEQKV